MQHEQKHGLRANVVRFHCDERGASYQLGMILLLPLYVLLIACTIELALALNAKVVVTHAAYAAGRAATVQLVAEEMPLEARLGIVYAAAANSLASVASGNEKHQIPSSNYFQFPASAANDWAKAYADYSDASHEIEYLSRKFAYAGRSIRLRVTPQSDEFNSPFKIQLEYEHPFHTAGAGFVFGRIAAHLGVAFRTITIRSEVTMEREGIRPADDDTNSTPTLGILFHRDFGFVGREF